MWQHFTALDPKTEARIVLFVLAHWVDERGRQEIIRRLQGKYPGFYGWGYDWRRTYARLPQEAFMAGLN